MIALIADDLTGASDAGVQFARRGLASWVLFDVADLSAARAVEALAVDTETRAVPPDQAYARVRQVADALRDVAPDHVYKKVDSTLRGNLGAEIEAVMDAFDFSMAVVAPAFPALGRTTRGGVHFLRGVPVHETEIGRDPKAPVRQSHLVRLLECESRQGVGLIDAETVAQGPTAIRHAAERLSADRRRVSLLVCDVEDETHLQSIARSFADRSDLLWVGSAGLAEYLVEALALRGNGPSSASPHDLPGGPILLVAGSVSETTRQQVAALCHRRDVMVVEIDTSRLFAGAAECHAELQRCGDALHGALEANRDTALVAGARCVDGADTSRAARIADALGTLAADCVRTRRLGGLILTGGDTARAVCEHIGITGIQLLAEVEPGVPLGLPIGNPSASVPTITKAGAFGSETTLIRALDRLKETSDYNNSNDRG